MKTFIVILGTLMISQILYVEYGPHNPVAQVGAAITESVRWFLHSALNMVE